MEQYLPLLFCLDGVLYSMPVSDILTFAVTTYLIVRTFRELRVENGGEKLPDMQEITA